MQLCDAPWRVRQVHTVGDSSSVIDVEPLGYPGSILSVVSPPEEIGLLPPEEPKFDLRSLDTFASWCRAHQILEATSVGESGLISGARFGRVELELYQLAPALRVLSKPQPSLLMPTMLALARPLRLALYFWN